jgi:hypothetical protein
MYGSPATVAAAVYADPSAIGVGTSGALPAMTVVDGMGYFVPAVPVMTLGTRTPVPEFPSARQGVVGIAEAAPAIPLRY